MACDNAGHFEHRECCVNPLGENSTFKQTLPFQNDPYKASFHIPLHRYFAVFVRQVVKCQGFTLQELLPDNEMLTLMMQHPLRVQVGPSSSISFLMGGN